jgi:hypothetical protein
MIYSLEILKARHLKVLGLGREAEEPEPEQDGAVDRVLTGTGR